MTLNVPLLRQTLEQIEAHPEEWNQGAWRCQTGMCFAGWAACLAGGTWADTPDSDISECLVAEDGDRYTWVDEDHPDIVLVDADARAAKVLGLRGYETTKLFAPLNTLDDLRRIVADLIAEAE